MKTTVRIERGEQSATDKPYFAEYTVDCEPGSTVLDGLRTIQRTADPTLSFRWECRAGICGICTVMVDDKPCLSCETPLEPGREVTIKPLRGFPVVKDLIVDVSPAVIRLAQAKPYLIPAVAEPPRITKMEADRSKQFRRCIECFACIAASNSHNGHEHGALDTLGIVKLARFATDPRDGEDRPSLARAEGIGFYTREELREVSTVCPKHIDIVAAYEVLTAAPKETDR